MNISMRFFGRHMKYYRIMKRVIIKKPLVLLRILVNYFRIWVLKENVVRKVEMGLTFDCQCHCPKCSSEMMRGHKKERLGLAEIAKAASEILELGAVQINLTGGEPLMAEDFFQIVRCFKPHKTIITINTNGLLLTEDMIDRLERAGVDIIKISIDSPIEAEHDKYRGYDGCYSRAIKALSYIKSKSSILGQISTVCIKENLGSDRIWKLVEMAREYDALLGLTIPAASGRWLGQDGVLLDEKDREVLGALVKIPHVIRDTDEGYMRSHCPAGSEEFYLTCYGDIIPCPLIQISFGNVKSLPLRVIWQRMSDYKVFKEKKGLGCLAGEDRDFIDRYLMPLKDKASLPVSIEEHHTSKVEDDLV
ncbi:MAG: radical SAM protein [Candidatus Omnitrophica bacterium]|nr:radical SAM protein [Candidatus Omnitrophota bacterium]